MMIRGSDFPFFLFVFKDVYKAFTSEDMVHKMKNAMYYHFVIAGGVLVASAIGVISCITELTLQTSLLCLAGERCLLRIKVNIFNALLHRRSDYFDRQGNSPAILIPQLDQLPPAFRAVIFFITTTASVSCWMSASRRSFTTSRPALVVLDCVSTLLGRFFPFFGKMCRSDCLEWESSSPLELSCFFSDSLSLQGIAVSTSERMLAR